MSYRRAGRKHWKVPLFARVCDFNFGVQLDGQALQDVWEQGES